MDIAAQQEQAAAWFKELRNRICTTFEEIEQEILDVDTPPPHFERKKWERAGGGGGEMSLMRGKVFEKVGVNISTVFGEFSGDFRKQIPGTEESAAFWASGISLVAHMRSPHVPAVHMNTRFIVTGKSWFGGGADLTPVFSNSQDNEFFHAALKQTCDAYNPEYYSRFKKQCDEYFFLPHRGEARGIGGIFYDYINSGSFEQDFFFTQAVGNTFLDVYPILVRRHMQKSWTEAEREQLLYKRGRYAEFNLLHDRGTKFGLMTGGNTEAILMSLPPEVKW